MEYQVTPQTFTMNITYLPENGANVSVYKTTANGNDFFGNAVALTLGINSITVPGVNFDRTVKFRFSTGNIEFDALNLNGELSDCAVASEEPEPIITGCTNAIACNFDANAIEDDGSCTFAFSGLDCDGNCLDDADSDGICDDDEVTGCQDETATNYDPTATDEGDCTYSAPMVNLFFSEYAEGSSNNKYLEIFNPSSEAVSLADYAFPSVSNAPATVGEYEYWNTFDEGATIPANDVYVIAHPSSDTTILAFANMTHYYLSNGDDGYALAYGNENGYEIIDFIGDFNGDPEVVEVVVYSNGTKDHTLVRKCSVESGN